MEQLLVIIVFVIIGIGISITLNKENRIWGICVSIAVGTTLLFFAMPYLTEIINTVKDLCNLLDDDIKKWLGIITKISVIALAGEGALALCKDAGESSIAFKLELCVKIIIIAMSMPIVVELAKLLIEVLSQYK